MKERKDIESLKSLNPVLSYSQSQILWSCVLFNWRHLTLESSDQTSSLGAMLLMARVANFYPLTLRSSYQERSDSPLSKLTWSILLFIYFSMYTFVYWGKICTNQGQRSTVNIFGHWVLKEKLLFVVFLTFSPTLLVIKVILSEICLR